uniref:Retrotransposon Copia-like N-terminal domain-containing protein n=1 Tax=Vitis vinifera TaxID=29760 RepID=A5BJG9_VITVI|nr:hypothetical protein VITISV_000271 [Vitis vinifera]
MERVSEIQSSMGSVGAFENSSLHLTVEKLNGKNYREWAQAIKLIIDEKGKLGFLTDETRQPPPTDVAASQKWQFENSFTTSCLINSMKPSIGKTYMFFLTAKNVWDAIRETCEEEWEGMRDNVCFKKKMENERVFEFLTVLNRELDDIRSRVLSRRLLPSIREVFSEVGLLLLDLVGQAQDSPRGLIVSIVRSWATLKTLVGPYMASPHIGSPDTPLKPIVIRPPPKPRQTKLP